MSKLLVYTDGGARGNPGPAAVGIIIKSAENNPQIVGTVSKYIGETTNNVAEYTAVLEALQWLLKNSHLLTNIAGINFYLDSNLVVNQLNGQFKIKDSKLISLFLSCKNLQQKTKIAVTYNFIRRIENQEADKLVNQALDNFEYK